MEGNDGGAEPRGEKILLYGAGDVGSRIAASLQYEKVGFYGFCDGRADSFKEGVMGKPVVSPEYLFRHSDECYVILTLAERDGVLRAFAENQFPEDHILRFLYAEEQEKYAYFAFPSLYRRGTAFVDGGCLDCSTDRAFAEWCGGDYSRIFAFEPDPKSYAVCLEKGRDIRGLRLIQAGLSDRAGTAAFFAAGSSGAGHLHTPRDAPSAQKITIRTTTIDEAVGGETVGMIKLDVEGAELAALRGAERTIRRDKPLLAICAYHLPGDTFALMDYLERVVPEYRFWLRHHAGFAALDTVLYASVDAS